MYKIKETIYPIFEGNDKGIAIDAANISKELGKIKKINYAHFKYIGSKRLEDSNNRNFNKTVEFIRIDNMSEQLMKIVVDEINAILDKENTSITSAIDKIIDLFSKRKYVKEIRDQLYGDLGEIIFILKCQEHNVDATKYLRNYDKALYDFKFGDRFVEIKSASSDKNDFIVTDKQLNEISKKNIILTKFKCLEGEKTILDLYNMINTNNELLLAKKKKWSAINSDEDVVAENLLANYSVKLENCHCYLFKNEKLPKIIIEEYNALKSAKFNINCTESELKLFEEFINWCKTNNIH